MKSIAIRSVTGAALVLAASWAVHTQDRQENTGDRPAAPAGLILEKSDTIEFTTDEGTWMSLDVSPDGRTIAFDLVGDLYTLPIDGGNASRIAGGKAVDKQPLGEGGGPPRPAPNRMGAVASPDGKFIFYAERMGTFTYNARFPLWQIIRFDRETGDTSTITNAQGSAMRPVLSPDGKSLVFATRFETATGLRIRNLETGDERWLIYPVTRDDQESRASRDTMPGYAFVPDGQSLIVPIDGHIHRVDLSSGRSRVIPFTAKVEAEIAPRLLFENKVDDGPVVRAKLIRWPAISPDGRRAVFSSLNHVWIMDLPNGQPQRLTTLSQAVFMHPCSPDGRSVALVTWSRQGGQLYRVSAAPGSQPEQLSRYAAYYSEPVYTPDGTKIVYVTGTRTDQLYADLRYIQAGHSDVEQDDSPAELSGIRETADMDLRWIPASGGEATLIRSAQGGLASADFANGRGPIHLTGRRGPTPIRVDG